MSAIDAMKKKLESPAGRIGKMVVGALTGNPAMIADGAAKKGSPAAGIAGMANMASTASGALSGAPSAPVDTAFSRRLQLLNQPKPNMLG